MKRFIILIVLVLLITGCSKEVEPAPVRSVKEVTLQEEDRQYTVHIVDGDYNEAYTEIESYINTFPRKKQQFATLSSDLTYTPPVEGTEVDIQALFDQVRKGVPFIQVEDFYINEPQPNIADIERVQNQLQTFKIEYTNGEVVSANDCKFTVSEDFTLIPDKDAVYERVKDISLMYDTVGQETYDYTKYNGEVIHTQSNTWGNLSDTVAEQEYIFDKVCSLESEIERKPIMKEESPEELPSRRIEVDIENQKVYLIDDQDILMESPVVTGLVPKRATPTGVFKILERRKEKDLRGPGYVSHVHRWLRLTWQGVGLHDATWRSKFGGDIYLHDGSHGCINLPKEFAYDLYDVVNVGDCVIIY